MNLNGELLFRRHALDVFLPGSAVLEVGPSTVPTPFQGVVGDDGAHGSRLISSARRSTGAWWTS
jgi:hypothetical protein